MNQIDGFHFERFLHAYDIYYFPTPFPLYATLSRISHVLGIFLKYNVFWSHSCPIIYPYTPPLLPFLLYTFLSMTQWLSLNMCLILVTCSWTRLKKKMIGSLKYHLSPAYGKMSVNYGEQLAYCRKTVNWLERSKFHFWGGSRKFAFLNSCI